MEKIISFFVSNWRFSFVLTVIVAVAGLFGLSTMQRETFPPVNFAVVSISTIYPGASPEEVQEKVTNLIEDELRGIEGLKDVQSTSQSERSQINVRIDIDHVETDQIVNDIQRAVQRASSRLPPELPEAPTVLEIKAQEIPVLEMAVVGSNEGRKRDILADKLKKDLEDIKGVSSVRLSGYREREFQILLNPQKMNQLYVGLSEVTAAVSGKVKNIPAGYLRGEDNIRLVRLIGQVKTAKELEDIVVRANNSRSIRIKDVGKVVEGSEEATILSRWNGQEATLLIVTKKGGSDALTVLDTAKERLESFRKNLPEGFSVHVYNDEGQRIANRLSIVTNNAVSGLIIVLLVLFFFLPGKIGLMSALSLPICVMGTVAGMVYLGADFNIITMLALIICLGNLVDNSVVIAENYSSLIEKGIDGRAAAIQSAKQFWIPFTASTITIVAAFLPMLVTKGVMGQFIRWIPIVVTVALVISLIEAITLLPARLQFLGYKKPKSGESSYFSRVENWFMEIIRICLNRKRLAFASLTGLVLSGFLVTGLFNRFELFPDEGVEFYIARFEGPLEMSIEATDRIGHELSKSVMAELGPEVLQSVIARSGVQQTDGGDPLAKNGENVGIMVIAIKPEKVPSLDIQGTLKRLQGLPKPKGATAVTFETLAGGPPVGKPLTVTLRSSEYEPLRKMADAIKKEIADTPGLFALADNDIPGGPEYTLRLKGFETALSGLSVEQVGISLRSALEGFTAAKLTASSNEFEVRVRLSDEYRQQFSDIDQLRIRNPQGILIPLSSIANIEEGASPSLRKHYDFKRSITITAEVVPEKLTSSQINEKTRAIFERLKPDYPSVTAIFGGEEENTNESLASLAIALVLAVVGIFATLVFVFQSFTKPFLILSSVPLGLVGVCYAFVLDQRPLSFLAFIGVIGLSGVVINSAIILVDYIDELRKEMGGSMEFKEILVLASGRRLRAVLATGLTTVVGLLPTAFGWGGYDPILVPMTLALSWGMIVGTVLSLIWIPVGYFVLEGARTRTINWAKYFVGLLQRVFS